MNRLHPYQIAFVVDDLETAAEHWLKRGAGPFYAFDSFVFSEVTFPTGARSPKLSILLGYSGDVMIELIEVLEDESGIFDSGSSSAVHHIARLVPSIDEYLEQHPFDAASLLMKAVFPTGTPIAYLDTREALGVLTELVTVDESVEGMIVTMKSASESGWTGPGIREFT